MTGRNGSGTMSTHLVTRDTVVIAVFGGLWGFVELTLGVPLKALRVPLSGAVLAAAAAVVCLTGRAFVPRFGAVLMMGCVAALVKLFSTGFVILGPFLAILIEAAIAEILTTVLGVRRVSFILTGMFLLLYTIVHPFLMQGVLFGAEILAIYLEIVQRAGRFLHLEVRHLGLLAFAYAGLHALAGALAGGVAWELASRVRQELRRTQAGESASADAGERPPGARGAGTDDPGSLSGSAGEGMKSRGTRGAHP